MSACVIFDCDGTLVDSETLCNQAFVALLRDLGVEERTEALVERYRGAKLQSILDDLQNRHGLTLPEGFVADYRALVTQLFENELKPVTGVAEALEKIRMPMCVASSGPPEKIVQALRVAGLARYFGSNLFSSYQVGSWKPEPGLFLAAATAMGVAAADCIVVEDSPVGIAAAKAAGMRALWFEPGRRHPAEIEPDVVAFGDMALLPELILDLALD
ncbi:HAD-IA family hydrolase [Chitinimonas lacunae]|uniref:HAD-IA family hydrolase n=1 Tax=Chitinimonas lacunae TaxID=1963018 RepID=A0ABV8MTT3_9NEIS